MTETFKNFLNQIPSVIKAETEANFDSNIIVFRPLSYIVGWETHLEDYHFSLPTSDPPPIKLERQEYQFKKGDLLSIPPETSILCTKPAPTGQYIALNIKKDFFEGIAREVIGKTDLSLIRLNNTYSSQLVGFIGSFEEELKNYQSTSPLMLESMGTQIVIQLLRENGSADGVRKKKPPVHSKYVDRAKEYINAFYNANIKIADICKEVHLSPYYFMRMFKEHTGQSLHEFLLGVRMSKAEVLLQNENYSIEEVARLCGFVNSAHFSNHFKKVKNMPPSEYRRKVIFKET